MPTLSSTPEKTKGNQNPITEREYLEIKEVLKMPLSRSERVRYTGRSVGVINRIKYSHSWEYYQKGMEILAEWAREDRSVNFEMERAND